MCKTSSLTGSALEMSFAEETGALSPATKTRISPKPLSLWGRAHRASVWSMAGQLHSLARARGANNREDMAEGEHKHRHEENIHFWDKCYSSRGMWQELPQAAPAHCSATAPRWRHPQGLHRQTLPQLPETGCQGGWWGTVWLLIAASVPALIDRAGRAGPCYDCLCLRGWWQHGRWWGWATQICLLWGGMDPAWQQDEEGARKG